MKPLKQLKNALLTQNPVLNQLLGMCSVLAVSTTVSSAFGMGVTVTAVLICSNVFISLLSPVIPQQVRIVSYIVIIAGFVTAAELLINAFFPSLASSLGVFIPLIVVNCIILARDEMFASKNSVPASALDGLFMGLGYTAAIVLLGALREVLGNGTLAGIPVLGSGFRPILMLNFAPGAFIALGLLLALVQKLTARLGQKGE
ncbi:MAG: electron transport complex subunit RsxE [Clostridia bacterium]|nr:electron transport complex subunit RsxE [Clostridia bacterium]